tara:strand:+ start:227 stop:1012 length:786 start_codon:yes stop_codon:yes gene_type:complete
MTDSKTTVTFLGTSSVTPGAGRDTASFLINGKYLVDTGWYATIKMLSYGVSPLDIEYLFITHCHHDHYIGLPQLLFYHRMRRKDRPERPPLNIVGPAEDLEKVVTLARNFLQTDRFPDVECVPVLYPLQGGDSHETEDFRLDTISSVHPVAGLVYRFTDKKTGAVFGFTGDTAYHPPIAEHVRGVSLLVHEASYGAKPAPESNSSLHAGAPEAAKIAKAAGVGRLALVHCTEEMQKDSVKSAQGIFPNTFWPEDGETIEID